MNQDKTTIKYFLYARKSSESDDKQVQSIDDQINRLTKLAGDYGLTIAKVFKEAHSAKTPNERPVFNNMLERIDKGEANGLLWWQINRRAGKRVDGAGGRGVVQKGGVK